MQELELPFGGLAAVDSRKFVSRDFGEVALKGGTLEFHPHALIASFGLGAPVLEGTPLRWSVGLGYRLSLGTWWGSATLGWGTSRSAAQLISITDHRGALELAGGPRLWLGPAIVMLGGATEISLLRQQVVREREAEILKSYPALPPRLTLGVSVGPVARLELPLVGPLFMTAAVGVQLRALPSTDAPLWTFGANGALGVGLRL
jgi:hypothetical protein